MYYYWTLLQTMYLLTNPFSSRHTNVHTDYCTQFPFNYGTLEKFSACNPGITLYKISIIPDAFKSY